MKKTLPTGIIADKPTKAGNVYTRAAIDKMISDSKLDVETGSVIGGIIDRKHTQNIGDKTHVVRGLHVSETDELMVDVEITDDEVATRIAEGQRPVAKPVIERSIPLIEGERVTKEEDIIRLRNIQIEF